MSKRILALLLILSLLAGIPVLNASAADEDDVLRMIVIGNSYGYDSTQLLWKVYQTQNPDKKVQIGAMYYSGCSIEQHLNFIRQESAVYDYKRTDENGTWVTTNDVTLDTGLLDQQWDVVILMQGSGRGGADPYYFRNGQIQKLQEYVLSKLEVKPQFYWNLTWVSPQDTYFQDPDYMTQPPEGWADTLLDKSNGDSLGLFRRFAEGARTYIASDPTFAKVITPGTAIHYANNVLTDRDLYRDYTHLSDYGRVIAAHTIYCQIEGLTTLGSINMDMVEQSLRHSKFQKYGDLTITAEQKQIALEAVNHALKNPYEVPDTPVTAERCMNCTTEPVWTAWDGSTLAATDGHYYLTKDVTLSKTNVLTAGDYTISINLNGHALTSNSRAFEVEEGVTLSIMDSVGTGKVSAKGISGQNGAVVSVHSGGTFALQSGTLTMPSSNNDGSVVYVENGDMKVHGGKITDERADTTEDVYMSGSSTLYARDGEISSLLTDGQVTVSRYAKIGSLTPGTGAVLSELVTIDHFYIGSVGLNLSVTAEAGLDLGGGDEEASLNGECFYLLGNDSYGAVLQDSQLVLKEKAYCQHCEKMATWHAITENQSSEMVQRSGHFYLGFDAASYRITERILFSGTEACLDLNGKAYNGIIRAFAVDNGATLNVMGTGMILGRGSYGDLPGGTIYVLEGGTLNLYGGTLGSRLGITAKRTADKGGVLAVDGTFNMYGGKVDPTSSYTPEWWPAVGGAVYLGPKGNFNMSGGQILSGEVSDTAPCVYVDKGGQVGLTGDSDIGELYFAESSADSLTVKDSYTGTVSLRYPSDVSLDDMADVGNSQNAEVAHAFISFADAQGKTVAVSGTDLVVSQFPYTYGVCEVCGECWWTPVTDADLDAFGSYDMPPGHYRLTENVTTNQKSLNKNGDKPGTFCVDLAGYTFSGSTRGFLVYEGATLNIMDSVGGGVVEGCGAAAVSGGGLYVTKNSVVNFYGGTVRSNPVNSETRAAGGAVTVNGGTFNLYGGTVEGSSVTGNGGAIQVKSDYDVPGIFTATGGQVIAGTAAKNGNCISVEQGGNVVLSADAKIDEIFFYESSADLLTVSGSYSGTVALKYPETVELTDLTDIGNSMDGDVSHATISFTDVSDKTAAVKDSDLVVSGSSYTYGNCESCGLCQWIPVTDADMDAFGKYDMLPGHYILTEDVTTLQKQPNYNADHPGTYCIDLAGHAFNGESRAFVVRSDVKLNIMDSIGGGVVTGHVSSAAGGGVIYVANGEVHLYGGTVQHLGTISDIILAGGAVRVAGGTFHLHDGTIEGYPVSTYGGAVYVSTSSTSVGTFIASGGQVIESAAQTAGDCIYVTKDSMMVLSGDAVIDEISFAALSSDNLTVEGNYTGTTVLRYPDTAELTDLTDIGNSANGNVSDASITLYNTEGKTAAVKGTELVVSDLPYTYGTCEHCGDCQWMLVTEADLENLQPGHYRLSESIGASQQQLTTDGTYCMDLAGYTFTGASRAFYLGTGAILNIMDSVGGGVVEGKSGSSVTGGVIYIYSSATLNLYGGTLRHNTQNSETVTTGGVVCVSGGTFNMYNGTVEGANVTGYGGAVMVSSRSGLYGTVTISGGEITKGTAGGAGNCVYVNAGCKIVLTGNATVEDIRFTGDSADALEIVGIYTGTTVLRYPASVIPTDGTDIGNAENADISAAVITVANAPCMKVGVSGTDLVVNATHDYEAVVTAPTCTEAGYTTYTCACGDSYVTDEVAALGHSFEDGICTVCGEADPDYVKPIVIPTLTLKAPTLEFKDMICVVAFYTAENIDDVVEMGMITYTEKVDTVSVVTATHMIPGANYDEGSGRYYSSSQGIHAKYLADTVYLACYAKLSDGSYVYTKLAPYSPITYATNQLKNSTNTQLKQLVAAMLNYGAEAQLYFGHNVDNLANAGMTEEQQLLPESYREDMVQAVPAAAAEKQGTFANNKGFSARKPAVSFEGAFSINYFFTPAYTPVDGITLYCWNEADFNATDVLTVENASGSLKMEGTGTEQYRGDIVGISAKDLSQAVYVAAVYSDGTTTWTSGVLGYSIGAYCSSQASKGGDIADLAKATAVYGYHAKQYFG